MAKASSYKPQKPAGWAKGSQACKNTTGGKFVVPYKAKLASQELEMPEPHCSLSIEVSKGTMGSPTLVLDGDESSDEDRDGGRTSGSCKVRSVC